MTPSLNEEACTHPDHTEAESCADRAVGCRRDCRCCFPADQPCTPADLAETGSVYAEHIWQVSCPSYRDERGYLVGPGERWCRVVRRDAGPYRLIFLQQGKLPLPQSGAEADKRADVSWPLWQDADYLLGQELLSLKAEVGSGSIGPFPKEPLAGSPEAIAAAARQLAGSWPDAARIDYLEAENERLEAQLAERIRRHEADARDLEACRKSLKEETERAFKAEQDSEEVQRGVDDAWESFQRSHPERMLHKSDIFAGGWTAGYTAARARRIIP